MTTATPLAMYLQVPPLFETGLQHWTTAASDNGFTLQLRRPHGEGAHLKLSFDPDGGAFLHGEGDTLLEARAINTTGETVHVVLEIGGVKDIAPPHHADAAGRRVMHRNSAHCLSPATKFFCLVATSPVMKCRAFTNKGEIFTARITLKP